jgi:quinol monooxygenase YgiN
MITLAVAFLGAVVAAVGTGMLAARAIRAPRGDLIAWTFAMLGLAVGLGAVAIGSLSGFGPTAFRAMELGAQVLAPLALCLGLTEVVGRTVTARFTGRLLLSALALISLVILATDALTATGSFSKTWPDPSSHYETISNKLLQLGLAPTAAAVGLISLWLAASRSGRDPAWRGADTAICSGSCAALALAVPGLVALLGANIGIRLPFHGAEFAGLCLVAAALTLFGGLRLGPVRLAELHRGPEDDYYEDDWDQDGSWAGAGGYGGGLGPVTDVRGLYRDGGRYPEDPVPGRYPDDSFPGRYADDPGPGRDRGAGYPPGEYEVDPDDPQYPGGYLRDDQDLASPRPGEPDGAAGAGGPGGPSPWLPAGADLLPGPGTGTQAGRAAGPDPDVPDPRERMFGQIAIYTLIEDRAADFDRLTERVVAQVQAKEPDTLVYIVHAVPSAPLQRILYEVYRDRAAYDEHCRQPYVTRFERDREPFVLATNVIELGLQQAKVSAFPSISDLLDQTGISSPDFSRPLPRIDDARPGPGHQGPGQRGSGQRGPGQRRSGQQGSGQQGSGQRGSGQPPADLPGSGQRLPDPPDLVQPGYGAAGDESSGPGQSGLRTPGYLDSLPGYRDPGYSRAVPGQPEAGRGSRSPRPDPRRPRRPDPLGPDPRRPDPLGPDPLGSDPLGSDPLGSDSRRPDPLGSDPLGPDPRRPDPRRPDPRRPRRPDPLGPDPRQPDPLGSDPLGPDPRRPDPDRPDPLGPDPRRPDPLGPDPRAQQGQP